jgi:hypothetical protein
VTLLQSFSGGRGVSVQELFWNRSIARVALLPGAAPFDSFRTERASVAADGSLSVAGRALAGPLLVDTYGSTVRLRDARLLEAGPTAALWVPDGSRRPRLSLYALGRFADGWLASAGLIVVWPRERGGPVAGWLAMRLSAPPVTGAATVRFRSAGRLLAAAPVRPGAPRRVRIPVCSIGPARITYRAPLLAIVAGHPATVKSSPPRFVASRAACAAS